MSGFPGISSGVVTRPGWTVLCILMLVETKAICGCFRVCQIFGITRTNAAATSGPVLTLQSCSYPSPPPIPFLFPSSNKKSWNEALSWERHLSGLLIIHQSSLHLSDYTHSLPKLPLSPIYPALPASKETTVWFNFSASILCLLSIDKLPCVWSAIMNAHNYLDDFLQEMIDSPLILVRLP